MKNISSWQGLWVARAASLCLGLCYSISVGPVAVSFFFSRQIPPELIKMAEEFQSKVDSGQARKASSGFSGKGFTFDDSEQSESQQVSKRASLSCSAG